MFGNSARVGLVVLIGIGLIAFMFAFFSNLGVASRTYPIDVIFSDASGIDKDADVDLAGVRVGKVASVELAGQKAVAHLLILKDKKIPVGSQFLIQIPALSAMGHVDIVPQQVSTATPKYIQPGQANLVGGRALDIQQSLTKADNMMDKLTVTVGKVNDLLDHTNRIVGDPAIRTNMDKTLANTQLASQNVVLISRQLSVALDQDNSELLQILRQSRRGSTAAIDNLTAASADVRQMTAENREKINSIISNMEDTTSAISGLTSQANDLLSSGGVSKNLSAIVANLSATTQKLDAAMANLQTLTSDANMQGDLKATVHNLRQTTDQTTIMVQRLNHLLGVKDTTAATAPTTTPATTPPAAPEMHSEIPRAPLYLPRVDFLQNTTHGHFRSNVDLIAPIGPDFADVGIYGFGDTNRLNLEGGRMLDGPSGAAVRAGLYNSKLALGADLGLGKPLSLQADVYDPNHLRADIHGILMLNDEAGLVVGADDIGRNTGAVVGIELRH